MGVNASAPITDQYMLWILAGLATGRAPFVLLDILFVAAAALCFKRRVARGVRLRWILVGTAALVPAALLSYLLIVGVTRDWDRAQLARKLGVPPPASYGMALDYPLSDLLRRLESTRATEPEVREALQDAKVRYECQARKVVGGPTVSREQKYVFFTSDRSSPRALVINVRYDVLGRVTYADTFESIDPTPIEHCTPVVPSLTDGRRRGGQVSGYQRLGGRQADE